MLDRVRFETVTALRSLFATPAPTTAAVLTLAVAVAVNLAMFGLIDRAILSPARHVVDPSRVLTFGFQAGDQPGAGRMTTTSYPTFASIRDGGPAIASAAFQSSTLAVMVDGEQRSARGMVITSSYFNVLGVRPMLGAPQNEPMVSGVLLRTRASAESLEAPIRRLVLGTHTDLPFVRVQPYANLLDRQMRPWRLGTTLLVWFSALALGVAAIGLYAAFTHAVAERRREMAIRIAIGAQPASVMRLVLREALTLAAAGAILGGVAAVFAGRIVQSLLFGTTPSDPLVLASAGAAMLVIATLATILPARAAAASNPNELLRSS